MKRLYIYTIIIIISLLFCLSDSIYAVGSITGESNPCVGVNTPFTVTGSSATTGYTWTVPSAATIISGTNSKTITLRFNAAGMGYYLAVSGNGVSAFIYVNALVNPSSIGPISGGASVCKGETDVIYTIPMVNGATGYGWSSVSGATGSSNTNSLSLNFSSSFSSGSLTAYVNMGGCGSVYSASKTITASGTVPGTPGTITGSTSVSTGQTNVPFSVGEIADATSYNWSLPSGASIASGAGTRNIMVNFPSNFTGGNISVYGSNVTCSGASSSPLYIGSNNMPGPAGSITGIGAVCTGSGTTYEFHVDPIANATSYQWTISGGPASSNGSTSNTILLSFPSALYNKNTLTLTVYGKNNLGNGTVSNPYHITTYLPTGVPGNIIGDAIVCPEESKIYSIPAAVEPSEMVQWSLPNGSPPVYNTTSITINYPSSFTSGIITVFATNGPCPSTSTTLNVSIPSLPQPAGTISGKSEICAGENGVIYTVPNITGATSYVWTLPSGVIVTGGNSISVDFSTEPVGTISVYGKNCVGNGTASSKTISIKPLPAAPVIKVENNIICAPASNVKYSITAISGATGYTWAVPSGATFTGQNTTDITVTYTSTAISGDISVYATNECGNSIPAILTVSVDKPVESPTSTPITLTDGKLCVGSTVTYTAAELINATSYDWTFPSGVNIIEGQGTRTIRLQLLQLVTNGRIYMQGRNSCGTGSQQSIGLDVVTTPRTVTDITGSQQVCIDHKNIPYSTTYFIEANEYIWTLPLGATIATGNNTNNITVDFPSSEMNANISVYAKNDCGSGTAFTIPVNINSYPSIVQQPTSITRNVGTNVTFTTTVTGNNLSYQWRKNNIPINSETTSSYTISNIKFPDAGDYNVFIINQGICGIMSATASLLVNSIMSQTDKNFIITRDILTDDILTETAIDNLSIGEIQESVAYFDGLGRSVQSVITQGSPSRLDIIQPVEYDAYGREKTKYLPYTDGTDGWYKSDALTDLSSTTGGGYYTGKQYNFYQNQGTASDHFPYSETVFENSPLNRVMKQMAPGSAWQAGDHPIRFEYLTNISNDVLLFGINSSNNCENSGGDLFNAHYYYKAGELYMTVTKDENWQPAQSDLNLHTTIEFKDKEGKVVLKRSFVEDQQGLTQKVETYYVYDDLGLLRYVLPPKAINSMGATISSAPTDTLVKQLCYYYEYDARKRMVLKQIPGAEPVYMVYDPRDRLVATQNGELRKTNKWMFSKYDALNRPVLTGIFTANAIYSQTAMQAQINNLYVDESSYKVSRDNSHISGYAVGESVPSTGHSVFQTIEYLTATYYDTYGFTGQQEFVTENNITGYSDTEGSHTEYFEGLKGQVTGTRISVLGDNTKWLLSTNYYDDKYRVIQTIRQNNIGGTDLVTNQYDFSGKVRQTYYKHEGLKTIEITKDFDYDHAGRLVKIYHTIDSNPKVLMSYMQYNELGQLVDKKIHSSDEGYTKFLQSIDYRYNIRGWLTHINNPDLGNLPANPTQDDLTKEKPDAFGMELRYNNPF